MKSETMTAKYLALENAAEMIRSHGEEGGINQDEWPIPIEIYRKQCLVLGRKLSKMAQKYNLKD